MNSKSDSRLMTHSTTRRSALKGLAAVSAAGALGLFDRPVQSSERRRPNILLLLADDLRYDGVGYLNQEVCTPNIDRLAREGVRFHNSFVTTSICCTSRASIFTGTYARRHGVWDFTTPLPPQLSKATYPALLHAAGYRTGFVGKYGVGDVDLDKHGKFQGFQVPKDDRMAYDVIENFSDYYDPQNLDRGHHNNRRIADKAEQFIRTNSKRQPFCLSLSFKAPHVDDGIDPIMGPFVPEVDVLANYANEIFTPGPTVIDTARPSAKDGIFKSLPGFLRDSESRARWVERFSSPWLWQDSVRKYYALITGMDRAIGRVMKVLQDRGMADNTVVIFTSDNGFFLGDYGLAGKWYGYEASIRVPLVIRLLRRPAVQQVNATALNIDLAPTMLTLAGLPVASAMQGRDLSPLWRGDVLDEPWRTDFLYEHFLSGLHEPSTEMEKMIPSSEGVRNERYTYLRYPRHQGENEQLFDRVTDPDEIRNIIQGASRELVEQLRRRTDELIALNS